MRILIADDHPIVREGLRQILKEGFDDIQIGEAADVWEVRQQVASKSWDLILMDLAMPGPSSFELLKWLKKECRLQVLVLSIHPEEQYAVRVLKAGGDGYLSKETAPDQLIEAIRQILSGKRYVRPQFAAELVDLLTSAHADKPHRKLTDREFEVLCRLGSGQSPTQIAQDLCLSIKTVSTHRANILKKMRLDTTAQLIRYALENGLLD